MYHTTVKITARDIKQHRPCPEGFMRVKPFLPLVLSTDPEDNIALAMAMLDHAPGLAFNVQWFATFFSRVGHVAQEGDYYNDVPGSWLVVDESGQATHYIDAHGQMRSVSACGNKYQRVNGTAFGITEDPYLVAQWLGAIADRVDVKRKRKARR